MREVLFKKKGGGNHQISKTCNARNIVYFPTVLGDGLINIEWKVMYIVKNEDDTTHPQTEKCI